MVSINVVVDTGFKLSQLVVEPTQFKNMLVKFDHFPKDWAEN